MTFLFERAKSRERLPAWASIYPLHLPLMGFVAVQGLALVALMNSALTGGTVWPLGVLLLLPALPLRSSWAAWRIGHYLKGVGEKDVWRGYWADGLMGLTMIVAMEALTLTVMAMAQGHSLWALGLGVTAVGGLVGSVFAVAEMIVSDLSRPRNLWGKLIGQSAQPKSLGRGTDGLLGLRKEAREEAMVNDDHGR